MIKIIKNKREKKNQITYELDILLFTVVMINITEYLVWIELQEIINIDETTNNIT